MHAFRHVIDAGQCNVLRYLLTTLLDRFHGPERHAVADGTIAVGFKNTAIQALIILATTLFFCPLAGYGFAKFQFPGKRFLFGLMEMNALG